MIDIDSLSMAFGDVSVLEDVSLSVDEGTFIGLVGPNGAGKTTLLRTISGALSPDSGTVAVDGTNIDSLSSRASSQLISVVPQDTSLSFSFDVRDIVEMGRTPYRSRFSPPTREDREIVDHALERTNVARFADRSIEDVSGGERQRVILARAIAQDTPVIVLDEPTASLDINHQVETLELVSDLVDDGKTAIAAIHDLDLAARYCDSLVVLAQGGILETGPPESVLTETRLAQAFDATATVTTNPTTGSPTVTALSGDELGDAQTLPDRVHVLGSGPPAVGAVARLDAAGIGVSFGPAVTTDSALETANRLGVDTISVEPFSPLEDDALTDTRDAIRESDVTVVADLHVSAGNQRLLEPIQQATSLVFVEISPFETRNTAGDGACKQYERARRRALSTATSDVCRAVATAWDERESESESERETSLPEPLESDND